MIMLRTNIRISSVVLFYSYYRLTVFQPYLNFFQTQYILLQNSSITELYMVCCNLITNVEVSINKSMMKPCYFFIL